MIVWYDNLPLISFLFLKGRCRSCHSPISIRYPIIEFLLAGLWLAAWLTLRPLFISNPFFLPTVFYLLLMIVITTATDLEWKIIPDQANYSLAIVGLLLSPWNPLLGDDALSRFGFSVVGMVAGGTILTLIAFAGRLIFGREAMGGGDIKLLAALGSILGWQGAVLSLFIGSLIGGAFAVVALMLRLIKKHHYLPFGPFLNAGALVGFIILLKKNILTP
jgi:leader peptidase (prepilin peptidase)/N-methyltransferase